MRMDFKNWVLKLNIFFVVLAAEVTPPKASDIALPTPRFTSVPQLIGEVVGWFMGFAGALAFIAILYSGIMYMTSAGDTEKAAKARKNLLWAIFGLLIIFGIYAIFTLVKQLFVSPL